MHFKVNLIFIKLLRHDCMNISRSSCVPNKVNVLYNTTLLHVLIQYHGILLGHIIKLKQSMKMYFIFTHNKTDIGYLMYVIRNS